MKSSTSFLKSFLVLAFPTLVGLLSSEISGMGSGQMSPYPNQPPLVPPGQVFPIVWSILFAFMGLALYLVLNTQIDKKNKKVALTIFIMQLFLNFIWPIVFFRFALCWPAFIIICVLWFLIFLNVVIFARIRKAAGYLLIPYLVWVGFALYLNLGYCTLN